jgi:predicted nucleic acid-binding protein
MTSLIVDASVAVKWFFREPDSQRAIDLRQGDHDIIAPELIIAEIGNAA